MLRFSHQTGIFALLRNIRVKILSDQTEWTGDGASGPKVRLTWVLGSAPGKGMLLPASGWARIWTIPVWLQGLYPYHQDSSCLGKGFTKCLFSYFHYSAMVSGYFVVVVLALDTLFLAEEREGIPEYIGNGDGNTWQPFILPSGPQIVDMWPGDNPYVVPVH